MPAAECGILLSKTISQPHHVHIRFLLKRSEFSLVSLPQQPDASVAFLATYPAAAATPVQDVGEEIMCRLSSTANRDIEIGRMAMLIVRMKYFYTVKLGLH